MSKLYILELSRTKADQFLNLLSLLFFAILKTSLWNFLFHFQSSKDFLHIAFSKSMILVKNSSHSAINNLMWFWETFGTIINNFLFPESDHLLVKLSFNLDFNKEGRAPVICPFFFQLDLDQYFSFSLMLF